MVRNTATSLLLTIGVSLVTAVSGQAYEVSPVSDGGSVQGKVVYNGSVPTKKVIPTKDTSVCGNPRTDPLVQVGPDKGVENAVAYLVGIEQGKDWPEAAAKPVLDQKDCRFVPKVQVMPTGTLEILNSDPVLHNTHGYYGRRTAFNLALPNEGQSVTTELARPGTVRVDCDAHGWMEGWLYVVANPYYAVTGADGTFSITDVPPGEYTLIVAQPYSGTVEQTITVSAGQAASVDVELKKN